MILFLEILLCIGIAWIGYVFVLYPLFMFTLSHVRPKPIRKREGYRPGVAFVMAAYNEERVIGERLRNFLELDYPRELLSFHVGSDGSTDATDAIIESYARECDRIHLHRFNRSGKTRIVYELADAVEEEIIIFTDADILLAPDAVTRIVEDFSDPKVGGVIGRMSYEDEGMDAGSTGQRTYLELENELRRAEALVWTTVGPRGECFAVRRGAYTPLRDYTLSDDLNLVITIPINGYRVWYDHLVRFRETSSRSLASEFQRRLRMGQQAAATLMAFPETRLPWRSLLAFEIWSHKLLRQTAAIPIVLVATVALPLALLDDLYHPIALFVLAWLAVMVVGWLLERLRVGIRVLQYPLYFTSMLLSLTIGSMRGVLHGGLDRWQSQREK